MVYYERYEDRTIFHDFWARFCHSVIFCYQQPPGAGLRGDRVVSAVAEAIGIRDMRCVKPRKKFAPANRVNRAKAFLVGLMQQRTHQASRDC